MGSNPIIPILKTDLFTENKMKEEFGQLRSYLNNLEELDQKEFFEFLENAYGSFPNLYRESWIPYMREFKVPCKFFYGLDSYLERGMIYPRIGLYLRHNQITDKDLESLSKMDSRFLESLDLYGNQITDKGLESLSKMDLRNLKFLYLRDNQITDKGLESLSKMDLRNLEWLYLRHNQITDKGVETLSQVDLSNLESLHLSDNRITDKGIESLSKMDLRNLKWLSISANQIKDKQKVKKLFPFVSYLFI